MTQEEMLTKYYRDLAYDPEFTRLVLEAGENRRYPGESLVIALKAQAYATDKLLQLRPAFTGPEGNHVGRSWVACTVHSCMGRADVFQEILRGRLGNFQGDGALSKHEEETCRFPLGLYYIHNSLAYYQGMITIEKSK